jgi:hypothetical protein
MAQQEATAAPRPRRFGTLATALVAGIAGGLLAPLIRPSLERNLRPAAKSLCKTGIALYERGRERAAEMGEFASDIMAEARAEYETARLVPNGADESGPSEVVRLRSAQGKESGSANA